MGFYSFNLLVCISSLFISLQSYSSWCSQQFLPSFLLFSLFVLTSIILVKMGLFFKQSEWIILAAIGSYRRWQVQAAFLFGFGMGSMQLWFFLGGLSLCHFCTLHLILKNTVKKMSSFMGCKRSYFLRWKGAVFSLICIASLNPGDHSRRKILY